MNEEFLTQDIDILPDTEDEVSNENSYTDMFPEEEIASEETESNETNNKEEDTNSGIDDELEMLLNWTLGSEESTTENNPTEEVEETQDETKPDETDSEVSDKLEDIKDKVEDAQENPDEAQETLKEIYKDLLETETALQASEMAKEVLQAKVWELQTKVSELEVAAASNYQTDNPDLMIVNKLLSSAETGSDVALPKVKNALNKIYLWLFNQTIEDGQVEDNLNNADSGISLNDSTLPTGRIEEPEEEQDPTDITSILG